MTHALQTAGGRARRARRLALAAALAALAIAVVVPSRVPGAVPGANGTIAFERFASGREDGRSAQLFTRAPDGTVRQLTHLAGGAWDPAWSPDGSLVAFERRHERTRAPDELFVMNADGSAAHALTTGCTRATKCIGDDLPAFSPDGRSIVFERIYGPIVKRNLRMSDRRRGRQTIEQASAVDLMIVGSAGGAPARLAHWGLDPQPWDGAPKFSPDGRSIVLAIGTATQPSPHSAIGTALHVLDANGGNARRITPWALGAGNPDWSPDGTRIVFTSEGGHTPFIYTVGANGEGLTQLTKNRPGHFDQFGMQAVWSPDGRQIAFAQSTPGVVTRRFPPPMDLAVMNADGTGVRVVTSGPALDLLPAWAPAH
jgi:Tol biopolymer transport system component